MKNGIIETFSASKNEYDRFKTLVEETKAEDGSSFDLSSIITVQGADISISSAFARMDVTNALVEDMFGDEDEMLIPFSLLSELRNHIGNFKSKTDSALLQFDNASEIGNITEIKGDLLEVFTEQGSQFNLVSQLVSVAIESDKILRSALEIQRLSTSKNFGDFSGIFSEFSARYEKIRTERKEINKIIEEFRAKKEEVEEFYNKTSSYAETIEKLCGEANEDNEQKKIEIDEINKSINTINEITQNAETLKKSVEEYQTDFNSFDTEMEKRNSNYKTARNNLDAAIVFIDESRETIEDRLERSEKMLTGATVAGLAGKFGDLHKELNTKLNWAAIGFYFSIAVLFATCVPILDYFFPVISEGLFSIEFANRTASTRDSVEDLLIRSILLLPASWLTIFSAKKYAHIFKLKEHYAYKYSIASAVDGFKHQAPDYKDAIAFSAFYELSFNPADSIDGKKMVADHPIRDFSKQIIDNMKSSLPFSKPVKNDEGSDI